MPDLAFDSDGLARDLLRHYEGREEFARLERGAGRFERERTRELLLRFLPPPPATVLDVGGAAGVHALWLARLGYRVQLVDLLEAHVEQAREASLLQPEHPLAGARVGDARRLDFTDSSVDAVLLLGPLYHLTESADRTAALREARRVVCPGGRVFAAGISRFASFLDGYSSGFLEDPEFEGIVMRDLKEGQHRNPNNRPGWFTTAYFHRPEELREEMTGADLLHEATLAIEGPLWAYPNPEWFWESESRTDQLFRLLREVEAEPSLLGASAHLLAIGRKD